jgi:F-type H+-transporting ATPase subunit alpha
VDVPVAAIKKFEKEFLEFMRNHHPEIGESIRSTREIKDDVVANLEEAIKSFKSGFSYEDLNRVN